jgi:phospholipid transport system substrate-binding protein
MEFSTLAKPRVPVFLAALFLLLLTLPAPREAAAAKLSAPQAVIQKLSDRMQRSLKGKPSPGRVYSLVNKILVPYINFHMVSKRALGSKYWNKASSGQRSRFASQFKRMLVRTYGSAFSSYNSWTMKHLPMSSKKSGKSVAVRTRVTPSGTSSVDVVYLMYRGKGGWRAYDIIISGVSLAKSHTASFQGIIRRSGMEGLIKELAAMNRGKSRKRS